MLRTNQTVELVYLVACCGPKLRQAAPAGDLYISPLFTKSRTYAERRGRWFILSALHGLLDPTTVIEPYNVTLKQKPAQERREWGQRVQKQMASVGIDEVEILALAGADYVKPLIAAGISVSQGNTETLPIELLCQFVQLCEPIPAVGH